jgi:hypothetical protein
LNGFVGAVVGGFEFAGGLVLGVGAVVEAAIGERAAHSRLWKNGFSDDQTPAALAALRPLNAYGWSKHVVDRRVADDVVLGRPTPPQWAGLKFFNVYGPNDMQSVVGKVCPIVEGGGIVTLFKSLDRLDNKIDVFAGKWHTRPGTVGGEIPMGTNTGFLDELHDIKERAASLRNGAETSVLTIGKRRVYCAPSQAGPGKDINTGSPGFQKAPTQDLAAGPP